ncbi:hypothetical protein [Lacisediminimonas profundi]|uniref:hypothetical protein n=1 Tax=Lacisediminimonas profundi TaxID=2603856 RepID=UPI001F4FC6AB|nr:hypothetical protein [Lacisediminimonas profundi]
MNQAIRAQQPFAVRGNEPTIGFQLLDARGNTVKATRHTFGCVYPPITEVFEDAK